MDRYIALTEFARNKFIASGFAPKDCGQAEFRRSRPGRERVPRGVRALRGRLSKEKGLHTLLDAWKRLPRVARSHIAGDGPQKQELEAEAQRCGLSAMQFRGRLIARKKHSQP